jgi:microsomal epoxide hydrolase
VKPESFRIRVPEAALDDLRERLFRARLPGEIPGTSWERGTPLSYLEELVAHWQTRFDWRAQEERLNRFAQFRTEIGGLGIHFVHEKGRGPNPAPLLLCHGWPSTFFEMTKIIPMLTDPARFGGDANDAFDVIVPSIPGYGFSDRPRQPGYSKWETAETYAQLMQELGYRRFFSHGGDVGAGITSRLGYLFPERVAGIHLTQFLDPYRGPGSRPLNPAETEYARYRDFWYWEEGGYNHLQRTRPQTLAYGLNDSPVGLAAWIVEKFRVWSDCGGDVETRFSKDELLTNITIYWITGTIGSSVHHYYEDQNQARTFGPDDRIAVPTAVALTREKLNIAPREWIERTYNVESFTVFPRGGHFMAFEEPELLADDLRESLRSLR